MNLMFDFNQEKKKKKKKKKKKEHLWINCTWISVFFEWIRKFTDIWKLIPLFQVL